MPKTRWIWPAVVLLAAAGGFLAGRHGRTGMLSAVYEDPRIAQLSARVQELEAQARSAQAGSRAQQGTPQHPSGTVQRPVECPPSASESQTESELQHLRTQVASSRDS